MTAPAPEVHIPFVPVRVRPALRIVVVVFLLLLGALVFATAGRSPQAGPIRAVFALVFLSIAASLLLRRAGGITVYKSDGRLVFRYPPAVSRTPRLITRELPTDGVREVAIEDQSNRHRIVLRYENGRSWPLLDEFTYDRKRQEAVAARLRGVLL